ncbi:hypothetical protein JTB14_022349 [Gonioctena quinquepunctata]|nr:hypothetical protein JTB14_022349 [Gonioctena quinquepunctata]
METTYLIASTKLPKYLAQQLMFQSCNDETKSISWLATRSVPADKNRVYRSNKRMQGGHQFIERGERGRAQATGIIFTSALLLFTKSDGTVATTPVEKSNLVAEIFYHYSC